MEEILKQILEGQQQLSRDVFGLKEDISRLESKVDRIAGSGEEDTVSLIKLMDKKIDTLSSKEDIKSLPRIETKLNLLESRLFEQETSIRLLTVVK